MAAQGRDEGLERERTEPPHPQPDLQPARQLLLQGPGHAGHVVGRSGCRGQHQADLGMPDHRRGQGQGEKRVGLRRPPVERMDVTDPEGTDPGPVPHAGDLDQSVPGRERVEHQAEPKEPSCRGACRPRLEHPVLLVEPSWSSRPYPLAGVLFVLRIFVRATYNAVMADATATTAGNGATTSLLASLHGLFDRLRAAGVPVSMVEVVDAVESLRHIDAANRRQFRSALAATLVKRPEDLAAFDLLFDVQFPLRRESAAAPSGPTAGPEGPGDGQTVPAAPSGDLLEALLDALRADDEGALRALAGLAVDQHGGMEIQRHGSERYYMYRIMRQLE